MARRGDYKTFYTLVKVSIVAIIGLITLTYKFLKNVARLNLWFDLLKSIICSMLSLAIIYVVSKSSEEIAGILLLVGIIYFCYWWHNKFSYKSTRLNSEFWQERQWWWTLDGWQFEQEVANIFRLNGYKATVTKGSGDGGVDIILKKGGVCSIVQCKHYQQPVPPEPIRALWGVKDDFNADEVILVASSGITDMGAKFVQNKPNYKVLNLDDIIIMSKQVDTEISNNNEKKVVSSYGRKLDM